MANSLLHACSSRSIQLVLSSMIRMGSRILSLNIALATALLLPRLLSFLNSLSSLLNPALIFVLFHLLILAIVLCSASSSSSSPPPQNEPFETHSTTPSDSRDSPPYSLPSPDPRLPSLPEEELLISSVPQQKKKEPSVVVVSDYQFEPPAIVPASSFVPVASKRTIVNTPTQLLQNFGIRIIPDPQMNNQVGLTESPSKEQQKKQLQVQEVAQQRNFAIDFSADDRMVRSKSDSRMFCTGASAKTCTKTITRRIEIMDIAPVDIRTERDSKSSSTIVIRLASFESLVEDDLCERCDKFIANIYENWKKESVEGKT